ncbi:DNA topoisomerase IV subunit A [Magnetospirillum gryphiswaldense]|uniref:DNA topoisomerase 4 subunit A n=2 Tax=Magnetospirillum gryphiswaldense TaxID=55518 RepID=V6EYN9_MAGGM|nr:DNA topoisomerase IV subunit A [Magnetospirillum gryphiswaldense]AVM73667.1 DNA topoisomerase 4 subunit A [Magnetospirillum gryphiswaldense MSR-1]AVM77570.1 DNA topoisomerase 4 subunit A [Magnetospirillum gryphiswaldense]CAM76722.1 Gram negative topoisomerase IV, subunit A [Magnetospirillum gryphiswaldense MSR-1]CDK98304.1 DNA topoisomerase IV, subunit A [Magnetospirillum gryphiswaldense MSR-1 v2]
MTQPAVSGDIRDTSLSEALGERYLAYAMSTIVSRSLPDVRDGLKPVHRRLLFAMRQLKLDPEGGFKKCARVVGDVIGKYHPHGDMSVYDAMVRLAQDFAVRYPLVEGQGNFGNIDGDNAAAMRYTEAKLTAVAAALMENLDDDTVDFRPTYDGSEEEPVVMPAAFPNLLANGAAGIAVGMATNIPPHNVGEICNALTHLIAAPDCPVDDLVRHMPGPDFPTGGVLVESQASIHEAYRSGRGSFRLRAKWEVEKLSHGLYQIIVTEIPYQVQKSKVIEKIAELLNEKKLPLLADIRDESAEDVRVVLEPRNRTVEAEMLMEQLFRQTDLEVRVSLNMNVLDRDAVPSVMNLKQVLQAFLDHRMEVLERRSRFRLDKIERRLEVLEGYLVAYLNLDEVIRIIREEDEPKAVMMRTFGLTEVQTEAILNMRLRSLRKLEEFEIRKEHDQLSAEKSDLEALLADESRRWSTIAAQVAATRKAFGPGTPLGDRRTQLADAPSAVVVPIEAFVEREPITLLLSEKGWIRAMKGHVDQLDGVKFKEGDQLKLALKAETTDKLLVFTSDGRFYTIGGDKLPSGRGFGEPLRLMIDMANDAEVLCVFAHKPGRKLLLSSSGGRGFIVEEAEVLAQTKAGKMVLNLGDEGEKAAFCLPAEGDAVAIIGDNRKLLVFMAEEIPVMARGRGVLLQKYRDGGVADIKVFTLADGLSWKSGERTRTEQDLTPWLGKRASVGRLPPTGFPRANKFT